MHNQPYHKYATLALWHQRFPQEYLFLDMSDVKDDGDLGKKGKLNILRPFSWLFFLAISMFFMCTSLNKHIKSYAKIINCTKQSKIDLTIVSGVMDMLSLQI